MIKKKKQVFIILIIIIGIIAFYYRVRIKDFVFELKKISLPHEVRNISGVFTDMNSSNFDGINLAVPFSTQAPDNDWSLPYGEACEETSIILVNSFYNNIELSPELVKQQILQIVDWENKTFGYNIDTTAEETARILREFLGYQRVDVVYDVSLMDIEEQITAGRPVIVPVAGRLLENPFYKYPGPVYHTLVVKGISKNGNIITNDVGTKRGHNYVYPADVFYNAIHDGPKNVNELSASELEKEVLSGRKVMVVVYPNEK